MSVAPLLTPVRRRTAGAGRLVALMVGLTAVVAATVLVAGERPFSDAAGRVTVTVPWTWSDQTSPEAGRSVGNDEPKWRVRDLKAGNLGFEQSVGVRIEPREQELAEQHLAEVDAFCYALACVDRGRPVSVEVNGRRGLEQVLTHASAEWTVLLTLESDRYLVTVDGGAGEFFNAWSIERLRRIVRTTVITD